MKSRWGWGLVSVVALVSFGPIASARVPQSAFPYSEPFAGTPTFADTWYAPWTFNVAPPSASITWSVEPTGGAPDATGNTSYLRAVRDDEGSSVQVLQYTVPQNTDLYVGCWMRCPNFDPSPGQNYWMEAGFRMGSWDGQNFDDPATGGNWTIIKKFEHLMTNGTEHDNNNVWTWYYSSTPVNTGANTAISIGFKVGDLYSTTYQPPAPGFDVGYDQITMSDSPIPVPPTGGSPPPPVPPGSTGGSGGHESHNLAHRCGCSSIGDPGLPAWIIGALLAALLGSAALRRSA